MDRKRPASLALALFFACALAAPASAAVCGSKPYSYAGLADGRTAHGVRATITALTPLRVEWGHVAGWVGVDGHDRRGRLGWIQVGFAGFYGGERRIYYEFKRPDSTPRFVELAGTVPFGEPHSVAVRKVPGRPSAWRVRLDGRAVSPAIRLPGSRRGWRAVATTESWNAGTGSCNALQFRFRGVTALRAGGLWRAFSRTSVLRDPGYAVRNRTRTAFRAGSA